MTIIEDEKHKIIATRVVLGWRMCVNYRELNVVTIKDHSPLPFIDQMLDRLAGYSYYCFLNGYTGHNQIMIALENQHKTAFTCPYEIFACRRMYLGLCTIYFPKMHDVNI